MRNNLFRSLLLLIVIVFFSSFLVELSAQCPMCKMAAETNLSSGGSEGKGLNRGILYMLSLPYLLVGFLGFLWYRNKKKHQDDLIQED